MKYIFLILIYLNQSISMENSPFKINRHSKTFLKATNLTHNVLEQAITEKLNTMPKKKSTPNIFLGAMGSIGYLEESVLQFLSKNGNLEKRCSIFFNDLPNTETEENNTFLIKKFKSLVDIATITQALFPLDKIDLKKILNQFEKMFKDNPDKYQEKIGALNESLFFDIFTCFNLLHFSEINQEKVLKNIQHSLKKNGLGILSFAFYNNYKNHPFKITSDNDFKSNIKDSFFTLKKKLNECPDIKNKEDFLKALPGNENLINNFFSALTINQIRNKENLTPEEINKILCNEYNNTTFKPEDMQNCFKSFCKENPSVKISGKFILEGFCKKKKTLFISENNFYDIETFYKTLKKILQEIKADNYYSGDVIIFIENNYNEDDDILIKISNTEPAII